MNHTIYHISIAIISAINFSKSVMCQNPNRKTHQDEAALLKHTN